MPDPETPQTSGGEGTAPEPRQSLREIAEAAYDDVSGEGSDEGSVESTQGDRGDGRDRHGRFAAKPREPGEAEPEAPSPDKTTEIQPKTDPAPQGTSNQPMEHWSAEDRAIFQKIPQDAQSMFMRRYQEMEADYTRKSQANAGAVQTVQALSPIFSDPDISRSLQEMQMHPVEAIGEWARFHKASVSPNIQTRASILYEFAQRLGFDPARVFARTGNSDRPPDLTPEQLADPTIRYFASRASKTDSDLQALRSEYSQFRAFEEQRLQQDALRVTRASVDAFADEKGSNGQPLRPYFDRVIDAMLLMLEKDPGRDMQETYETACWMDANVRKELMQAETNRISQQRANERAKLAVKGNVRGITSPVSKPSPEKKGNGNLRDALESSADEVGF